MVAGAQGEYGAAGANPWCVRNPGTASGQWGVGRIPSPR